MQKRLMVALIVSSMSLHGQEQAQSAMTDAGQAAATNVPAPVKTVTSESAEATPVQAIQAPAATVPATAALAAPVETQNNEKQPAVVILPATETETQPAQPVTPEAVPLPEEQAMPQEAAAQTQEAAPVEQEKIPQETPAPAMPASVEPAAKAEPEEDLEIKGIDTVDISDAKGNWLYKRIWWEKAERLYEKIKELADKIQEARLTFFAKRSDLNHSIIDPFYHNLGLDQTELVDLLSSLTQQEAPAEPTEKDQQLNLVVQEKKGLEDLLQEAENTTKLDHALDDALVKLIEQLNQARYYEQQAWHNFKAINKELSDKKARELYYAMDTYWKNLNSINSYISDAFSKYFDQLVHKIEQETTTMKDAIEHFKNMGLDLKTLSPKFTCKLPAKEEEAGQEESTSFFGKIVHGITAPFRMVGNLFTGVFGWIGSFFTGAQEEELALVKPSKPTPTAEIETASTEEEE